MIEELVSHVFALRNAAHLSHWATKSYSEHKALGKLYDDLIDKIDAIERVTKHDVIAFLTHLAEFVGPEARFVHQGMTSSDVLDTCLAVQLARAADLLIGDMDGLLAALKRYSTNEVMGGGQAAAAAS